MTFNAQSHRGSKMNWNGNAEAIVETYLVPSIQGDTVYLKEKGQFFPESASSPIPFHNTFKLFFKKEKIVFYHERFGSENPVWLFDLIATGANTLTNKAVHQCVDDQYSVQIIINKQTDRLRGSIGYWRTVKDVCDASIVEVGRVSSTG